MAILLLATAIFLSAHNGAEKLPTRKTLDSFPQEIGAWVGQDLPIAQDDLDVLGPGDFLSRVYHSKDQPYLGLFIAYFPSQRTGDTIHSPRNCLPGAGWAPVQSNRIQISTDRGQSFLANRYIIAKGADRELVVYWYQAHDRQVASEYSAKFYLVTDSIRLNRTDGALVRIVTPLAADEEIATAQERAVGFVQRILPSLSSYIPR